MHDPWLSTTEAADYLGMQRRSLHARIDAGEMEAFRFGDDIRVRRSAVKAFMELCRIKPGDLSTLYVKKHKEPMHD